MIKDVNLIVSYKYTDVELASWVIHIYRLFPDVTPEIIGKITDNMLKGVEFFDKDAGLLNYTRLINSYMGKFDRE